MCNTNTNWKRTRKSQCNIKTRFYSYVIKTMKFCLLLCFVFVVSCVHPSYKTKLCTTYKTTGRCPLNEKCTFAHGCDEVRHSDTPNLSKMVADHAGRITELETDLDLLWQHVLRLEKDNAHRILLH